MEKKELELYIHIPFCVKKCNYCDFLSFSADETIQRQYMEALQKEIAWYGARCRAYQLATVYIGGGTPSWLWEEYIDALMQQVYASFSVAPDAEISIECNPGTLTAAKLAVYKRCGINRLSIGVQSADNAELKMLGRIHTYEQFLKNYQLARESGFTNINLDLISALPGQTAQAFYETLHKICLLKPEHISSYSLMIEKGTPFYDLYKFDAVKQEAGMQTDALPTEDEVYAMTKMTEQVLKENGYVHYEVSNFALPGYECRHNIGYWKRTSYLGVGIGAASLMENIRYSNVRELYEYLKLTEQIQERTWETTAKDGTLRCVPAVNLHVSAEPLDRTAQIEEFMFLGLRLIRGVSREEFQKTFGVPIEAVYREVLLHLQEEELLLKRENRVFLTEKGQDLSNYVLAQFLLN